MAFKLTLIKKLSNLDAKAHLFAKILETFPLLVESALVIYDELYNKPYFGVADFVLRAQNKAFSAPKI